jgi:hypothetical protein
MAMAVSLPNPPAVAVAVNPATQTNELIVIVSLDTPVQTIYCSFALVTLPCPIADLTRADIAAATVAVAAAAEDNDDTETSDRPGSPSSVCARTPARRGSKLPAPPTTGKPNVWLSGLLSSLTPINVRRIAQAHDASGREELGI